MAEKIKKFFARKKADSKFKSAGPGHKLTEEAPRPKEGGSGAKAGKAPPPRTAPPEEARLAAQAALLRINSAARNEASFNTSLSAIQAQVKRELEAERKLQAEAKVVCPAPAAPEIVHLEAPPQLAVNGVFFRCPLISEEVLTKEEWKINIKSFLYEQLAEEPGLTACLILQSCNTSREKVDACVETLCRYLENIVTHPDEEKFHKIRMSNRVFCDKVRPLEGALELLQAAGFREMSLALGEAQAEEPFLVFDVANVESVDSLIMLMDALRSAEPIPLQLERGLQVLLPSQAAGRVDLPAAFYSISAEELKKEHQLRIETIEKSQMLRTKAMREKDELREIRKYKYALIRIRFPDGILLQGTFSVYDKISEVFAFVKENLEHEGLPFVLTSPGALRLSSEQLEEPAPDAAPGQTIAQLRLVPASVLIFAWDPSVAEEVARSPQKDVYLKPEVMILVRQA